LTLPNSPVAYSSTACLLWLSSDNVTFCLIRDVTGCQTTLPWGRVHALLEHHQTPHVSTQLFGPVLGCRGQTQSVDLPYRRYLRNKQNHESGRSSDGIASGENHGTHAHDICLELSHVRHSQVMSQRHAHNNPPGFRTSIAVAMLKHLLAGCQGCVRVQPGCCPPRAPVYLTHVARPFEVALRALGDPAVGTPHQPQARLKPRATRLFLPRLVCRTKQDFMRPLSSAAT